MNEFNYCIQCTDIKSGKMGSFFYDVDVYNETGKFSAISEVFPSCVCLYKWAKSAGYSHKCNYDYSCVMVYVKS